MSRFPVPLASLMILSAFMAFGPGIRPVHAESTGSGTITAEFLNPSPSCPPSECTGVGTSAFFWGTPDAGLPPNNLSFTGRGYAARLGEPFVLGLLQFQNSSTTNNIDTVDIRLQSTSVKNDPTFIQSAQLNLTVVQTVNLGVDPAADADYVLHQLSRVWKLSSP